MEKGEEEEEDLFVFANRMAEEENEKEKEQVDDHFIRLAQKVQELEDNINCDLSPVCNHQYDYLLGCYNEKHDEIHPKDHLLSLLMHHNNELEKELRLTVQKKRKYDEIEQENQRLKKDNEKLSSFSSKLDQENNTLKKDLDKAKTKNKRYKEDKIRNRKVQYQLERLKDSLKELPNMIRNIEKANADFH